MLLIKWICLKTKYVTDKSDLEKKISDPDQKIPDASGLFLKKKKTDYNAKITKSEGAIPSITGLATTAALTAVKDKILDVSNLVKEKDYDGKI